jgi:hypothetical protein
MKERMISFEIWQDGIVVAKVASENVEDAMREARHYAMIYEQDGPVEIRSVQEEAGKEN